MTHSKDHKKRSAELLRLVIPKMSRYDANFDPISYAVWYEYCLGENNELRQSVDAILAEHNALSVSQTEVLFRRYIHDCDVSSVHLMQDRMRILVHDILGNTHKTTQHASGFSLLLKTHINTLDENLSAQQLKGIMSVVLDETQQMATAINVLEQRLQSNAREIDKLRKELKQVREESMRDALTGLVNRGGFDKSLEEAMQNSQIYGAPLALMLIDIDFFKKINDTHGHVLGDRVIRHIGGLIRQHISVDDVAARYGGEEFAVLLPNTTLIDAEAIAEKIRKIVGETRLKRLDNNVNIGRVTLSAGVTLYQTGESARDFVQRADNALYASKRSGRNKVTVAN